jgi:gamma-glutamylcyclotransferase (GGCT)/AIG2-like uncharacterized protein YtfP
MNTNREGMSYRCPSAIALGAARLLDHAFRFSGPADVVIEPGCYVDGVLWDITPDCLQALDRLEGYPYYYLRAPLQVEFEGEIVEAVTYFMVPGHEDALPGQSYLDMVLEGYDYYGVPRDQLLNALVLPEDVAQ